MPRHLPRREDERRPPIGDPRPLPGLAARKRPRGRTTLHGRRRDVIRLSSSGVSARRNAEPYSRDGSLTDAPPLKRGNSNGNGGHEIRRATNPGPPSRQDLRLRPGGAILGATIPDHGALSAPGASVEISGPRSRKDRLAETSAVPGNLLR